MKAFKPLMFAALAGLPLMIGSAMAQNAPLVTGNGYPSNSANDPNTQPSTVKGLSAPHMPTQGGANVGSAGGESGGGGGGSSK